MAMRSWVVVVACSLVAGSVGAQGTMSTVAGGTPFVLKPEGMPATQTPLQDIGAIAVDALNRVYVAVSHGAGVGLVMRIQPDGTFHVIAGGAPAGSSGDGGPATSAYLNDPAALAFDAAGNLYIADTSANVVRKVTPSGIITTVAGNGTAGFGGDGGAASSAALNAPGGLAVDASGNLYIADTMNRRIRKVDRSGAISTFAGNGVFDYAGESGPATQAEFLVPLGLGFDPAGNLYVSDSSGRIRKISPAGNISLFSYWFDLFPGEFIAADYGLAVDAQGNVFAAVLDTSPNGAFIPYIIKFGQNGSRTLFTGKAAPPNWPDSGVLNLDKPFCCDGVAATQWQMTPIIGKQTNPAVAVDHAGNLFFSDLGYERVRKIDPSGMITTVAGNGGAPYQGEGGKATLASLQPQNARPDGHGNLLIADMGNHGVRLVGLDGIIHTIAGTNIPGDTGDGGPATAATLYYPTDAVEDAAGNIYISEMYSNRIRKIDAKGIITTLAGNGTPSSTGNGGPASQATLNAPEGLAIGPDGALYIAERGQGNPPGDGGVRRIAPDGTVFGVFGRFQSDALGFGPDGALYVAGGNLGAQPHIFQLSANAQGVIASPPVRVAIWGIAVDSSGVVYFSDPFGQRVGRRNTDGTITFFLGTGQAASSGDGGLASQASVNGPAGLSLDSKGVLYICESVGGRVRAYTPLPPLQISANGVLNAASYAGGAVAPEELVYLKGNTGATQLTVENSSSFQFDLGGVSIQITDSSGQKTYAPLYYVAPGQAVFLFPAGTPAGSATLTMRNDDGRSTTAIVTVASTAPGIFTANSSGSGPPAATVTHTAADGTTTTQYAFTQGAGGQLVTAPIDLGGPGDSAVLVLYGTGLRHHSQSVTANVAGVDLPVLFAGTQSVFGLDQVNLQLPHQLAGSGTVNLTLMVDGQAANIVQLLFQ